VIGGLDPQPANCAALYGAIFRAPFRSHRQRLRNDQTAREHLPLRHIALVNELKMLCLRMDLNIWEIIDAAATSRSASSVLSRPGLADTAFPSIPFISLGRQRVRLPHAFHRTAGEINVAMPYNVIASTISALNQQKKAINGSKVLVLGVAYKKDIDDLRESPALTIIELLQKEAPRSAITTYFPFVGRGRKYDLQMKCTPLENLGQYDCVLIVTTTAITITRRSSTRPNCGRLAQRHTRHQERQDRALLRAVTLSFQRHFLAGAASTGSRLLVLRLLPGRCVTPPFLG